MKKYIQKAAAILLGLTISQVNFAYSYYAEIDFCPQSDKVLGHCWIDLAPADMYNFVGGEIEECYTKLKKLSGSGYASGIVGEAKYFDGDYTSPRGVVISDEAHLIAAGGPLINNREYCVIFERATLWNYVWSESSNYIVKALGYWPSPAPSTIQSYTVCGTHETGQ